MKRLFSLILVGMLAVSGLSAKVKLSVLYVGGTANMDPMLMAPGSVDSVALAASVKERMAHFTKFLKKNFTNVKSIEGKDYTPEMSAAYDVTVFDGRTVPFRKGDRHERRARQLSARIVRPRRSHDRSYERRSRPQSRK